jgi:hypothetical protein
VVGAHGGVRGGRISAAGSRCWWCGGSVPGPLSCMHRPTCPALVDLYRGSKFNVLAVVDARVTCSSTILAYGWLARDRSASPAGSRLVAWGLLDGSK